jgi:predicted anti-sigma-YlaC factor YlaD
MMHQRKADCKQILNYLSAYIDGDLNEDLCQLIEDHLKTCQDCRIVIDTLKKRLISIKRMLRRSPFRQKSGLVYLHI